MARLTVTDIADARAMRPDHREMLAAGVLALLLPIVGRQQAAAALADYRPAVMELAAAWVVLRDWNEPERGLILDAIEAFDAQERTPRPAGAI